MRSLLSKKSSSPQTHRPAPLNLDSRSPPTGISEFGQYNQYARTHHHSPARQPPPSTIHQRRGTAIESSDLDRELPDIPVPYFLEARFPSEHQSDGHRLQQYGYMSEGNQVTLGIHTVLSLVVLVGKELESKALTTPLLFSTRALDLSSHRVRSLIRAFLRTVGRASYDTESERRWRDEVRFSGPHELATVLRWALSRIVRVQDNVELRGLVDVATYDEWRSEELERRYPADSYLSFPPRVMPEVQPLLSSLFPLLSRFAANASYSGLTPTALGNLFGPLIFGLSYPSQPFTATYNAYLVASHATEHLLLAYIRQQEWESLSKSAGSLPIRLKDWVRGYPAMLPGSRQALEQPRKGAKLVRVICVRRNVRLYSPNLLQTASTWATEAADPEAVKEWGRVAGTGKLAHAKYSEPYRKKLDLPMDAVPSAPYYRAPPTPARDENGNVIGTIVLPDVDKFKSLTDLRWGMFETSGFAQPDLQKLEFDLTETARKRRPTKRDTVAWADFANTGFNRDEFSLDFSPPVEASINTWPEHQAELHRKLRKQQKTLPTFAWSTEPVAGRDKVVEEGFLDCWADLLLSSGWMDRGEQTFRDCNWALVDYKAAPQGSSPTNSRYPAAMTPSGADNRTSDQWYVFEEFVPREYRETLANPKKKRGGIFSVKNKKILAVSTNGRPSPGPRSPAREAEFERILAADTGAGGKTTKISLSPVPPPPPEKTERPQASRQAQQQPQPPHTDSRLRKPPFPLHPIHTGPGPLDRLKSLGRHSPREATHPSEETAVEFEVAPASLSDESDRQEDAQGRGLMGRKRPAKIHEAWLDIRIPGEVRQRQSVADSTFDSSVQDHGERRRTPPPQPAVEEEDESNFEPVQPGHTGYADLFSDASPESEGNVNDSEYGTTPFHVGGEFPMPPNFPGPQPASHVPFPHPEHDFPSSDTEEEQGDFEPVEDVEPPPEEDGEAEADDAASEGSGPDRATPFDPNAPGGIPAAHWESMRSAEKSAKHGSGVSSLIELYQDRDRSAAERTSRIPVRVVTPPTLPLGPVASTSKPTSVSPKPTTPKPGTPPSGDSLVIEPSSSPFPRYVHGAPLHNLLEAEEEEEVD